MTRFRPLDGQAEKLIDLLHAGLAMRIQDLHEAGERLVDSISVARRDVTREREVRLIAVRVVRRTHRLEHLGDVVDHEPIAIREHLPADGVNLPSRDVMVEPVEVARVVIALGQLVEQVGVLEHVRNGVRGVAHEHHRRLCAKRLDSAGERRVRHVVLHDVDERLVRALLLAGELVERHDLPVTDETKPPVGVVDEQLRHGDLAAGDEHAVRRELREDVRLARALGAELDEVVASLDERDEPDQLDELGPPAEQLGVEPDGLHEQVDPLVAGELPPCSQVALKVEVRQLDRLDRAEDPRSDSCVVGVEILDVADTPDPPTSSFGCALIVTGSTSMPLMPRLANSAW